MAIYDRIACWHRWVDGRYVIVEPDADGVYRSAALPGFWLAIDHFWNGELTGLLNTAQAGVRTSKHAQLSNEL